MIPLQSRILPIRNAKHWKILLHSICYGNGKDTKGVEGMTENKPMDIVEKPTKNETVCEKSRGDRAIVEMRKHVSWYLSGMHGSAALRGRVNSITSLDELKELLNEYLDTVKEKELH